MDSTHSYCTKEECERELDLPLEIVKCAAALLRKIHPESKQGNSVHALLVLLVAAT